MTLLALLLYNGEDGLLRDMPGAIRLLERAIDVGDKKVHKHFFARVLFLKISGTYGTGLEKDVCWNRLYRAQCWMPQFFIWPCA